jgi:hypothetical protein
VTRKVESLNKRVSPDQRESDIKEGLAMTRRALRDGKGWNKKKTMRLVARIPRELINHVQLNDGQEAAKDIKHVLARGRELGIDCQVSKGRF